MLGQRMNAILKSGLILGGLLLLGMPTVARAVDVSDAGHFFSAEALEKANKAIAEIEKKSGHEIRIETHATVPADKVEAVSKMDRTQKKEFIHDWTKARAKEVKENGTLVLICKDPAQIKTWFSGKLNDEGMTQSDRDAVSDAFVTGFKAKNYDGALSDAVSKLHSGYAKLSPTHAKGHTSNNAPIHRSPVASHPIAVQKPMQSSWMPMIWTIGLVLLGMFVISSLIRAFSGGGGGRGYGGGGYGGQPGYGGGYGGGGGGFLSSMAGGIFGAVAGNWVYDQFSGGHSAHAHDSMSSNSDPLAGSSTLGDDNTSSSGNDWTDDGSSSGGGWFDGGDSGGGGGDFGGGDSGGGGDFGGGDF